MNLIFNERSLNAQASSRYAACQLVRKFAHLLREIEPYATDYALTLDEPTRLCPALLYSEEVFSEGIDINGYSMYSWLFDDDEDIELRRLVRGWIDRGELIELSKDFGALPVDSVQSFGKGLTLAEYHKKVVLSLPSSDGRVERLSVGTSSILSVPTKESWNENLAEIALGYCVKRRYENPGHHDPASPNFRGRGTTTSVLPELAETLYKAAVPENLNGGTWWARDGLGVYHRFQEHTRFCVHWNGSTDAGAERAIRSADIPSSVRKCLEGLEIRLP